MSKIFNPEDVQQIIERGSELAAVENQLELLKKGVFAPELISACTPDDGSVVILSEAEKQAAERKYDASKYELTIKRFVPSSGAASRMFKALLKHSKGKPNDGSVEFLNNLESFPFWQEVERMLSHQNQSTDTSILRNNPTALWEALLTGGLMYAEMPKGMIPFHYYPDGSRTAFAEQLYEAPWYADSNRGSHTHFTLAEDKVGLIKLHLDEITDHLNKQGIQSNYSYSVQHPSTDTLALGPDGEVFREGDGSILFRPGGHGSLIHNLNELNADLVFIKNIDNVVPDTHKAKSLSSKKVLAGLALQLREGIFGWLDALEGDEEISWDELNRFIEESLMVRNLKVYTRGEAIALLDRPLRVCGMVKNEGEPGGGPFWVAMNDGSLRPQIIEKAQIDLDQESQERILAASTHFNPVDIVALLKDRKGRSFDLKQFVDDEMAFITEKSFHGKSIKVLEHPGLWNGGMAYWNTIFVQVPLHSFNPVKTVNDLLRPAHRVILEEL